MTTIAVIVAAGRGRRVSATTGEKIAKQYLEIGGIPVLRWTAQAFMSHPRISRVLAVINPADRDLFASAVDGLPGTITWVAGGATRQKSVFSGLRALRVYAPEKVLIHDGARPFVSETLISRVLDGLAASPAVLPALPIAETVKRAAGGQVTGTVDREGLYTAQTPQGFRYGPIMEAFERAAQQHRETFTDDSALAEWAGFPVSLVDGETANIKITTGDDLSIANRKLFTEQNMPLSEYRTGSGFDVHAFTDGDHVTLCGVRIPSPVALKGHSDADVGLHALSDAILGAIGDGDIGVHFPPSEAQWQDAASEIFLADAAMRVRARGGTIANVDVTLICEAPKVAPHREAMRAEIGRILGIPIARVSVKATTTEGLGFTGRREGIAAQASATVRLPLRAQA